MCGTWGCKTSVSRRSFVGMCASHLVVLMKPDRGRGVHLQMSGGGFDGAISVVSRPPKSCRDAKCSSTSPRSSTLAPSPSMVGACSETPSYASHVISAARTSRLSSMMPPSGPNTSMRRLRAWASIWLQPWPSQIAVVAYARSVTVLLQLDDADSTRASDICYRSQWRCYNKECGCNQLRLHALPMKSGCATISQCQCCMGVCLCHCVILVI
jgi:hypothetical protein